MLPRLSLQLFSKDYSKEKCNSFLIILTKWMIKIVYEGVNEASLEDDRRERQTNNHSK